MGESISEGRRAALKAFETAISSESAIWRPYEWGDLRVGYETYLKDFDDAELLKGLPGEHCPCPHWGYLLAGQLTVRYADHEHIIQAGEVYDMAPGHTMVAEAGTVLIEFSPKEAFRELTKIAEKTLGQR